MHNNYARTEEVEHAILVSGQKLKRNKTKEREEKEKRK